MMLHMMLHNYIKHLADSYLSLSLENLAEDTVELLKKEWHQPSSPNFFFLSKMQHNT